MPYELIIIFGYAVPKEDGIEFVERFRQSQGIFETMGQCEIAGKEKITSMAPINVSSSHQLSLGAKGMEDSLPKEKMRKAENRFVCRALP